LQKGIKIEAGSDVSVVVRQTYTDSESYRAIPDSKLGTEYVVGTYCSNGGSCQFAVIATQDQTSVNIILPNSAASTVTCVSGQPLNGQSQGSDFVVTLNELDVFYLENANDLSGTRIVANNPISVIVGGRDIPDLNGNVGMMVEQIPPISKWGTEFMIGPGPRNDAGDIIKIVTHTANTEVYIQGFSEFIIPKGASAIERRIDWGMNSIVRTSYPVLILQVVSISLYTTTAGTIRGTPSMVVVPSKSQRKAQEESYVSCVSATYAFVVAWVQNPASSLACMSAPQSISPLSEVTRCEPTPTNGWFFVYEPSPFSAYAYCDPGELFLVNVDWTDHTGVLFKLHCIVARYKPVVIR